MTTKELQTMLNPSLLLCFEKELRAANGTVLVGAGQLAAVKLSVKTGGGFEDEVSIWDGPRTNHTVGGATVSEIAERARFVTADEERRWISLGEGEEES